MGLLNGPFLPSAGPVIDAQVGPPRERWFPRTSRRRVQHVRLLIDTGASRSAIRGDLLREMGLTPEGDARVSTPTQAGVRARAYTVRLALTGAPVLEDWTVLDLPPGSRGVDGLLGRDVIALGLLVVHGPTGTWTLAL